jgi:thioredoxin-like negative regulator of GroEL
MPPRLLQLVVISMVSCHTHASSLDADHAELLHSVREQLEGGGKVSETHISDLREALEENPKQVDLLTMLAYALLSRNQPDEAVTQMKKALKLAKQQGRNGADGTAKTLLKTLLRLNRFEEASQMYSTYDIPLDAATHSMLALRLAQGSQTEREGQAALLHSEKALEMAPLEPTP